MAERRYSAGALLRQINDLALDPGYQYRAQRRRAPGGGGPLRRSMVLATVFVAVGITAGAAAAQLRTVPSQARARAVLIEQIERRQAIVDELAADNEAVRTDIDATEGPLLSQDGGGSEALGQLGVAAGALTVTGPGLVIELTDAPVDELTGERVDPLSRVRDTDIQTVANGLWLAGAEAVAVNGHRLTSLSAIRRAGDAILVDFRPLAPPYRVEAIGEPETLAEELSTGTAGRYTAFLRDNYGIGVRVDQEQGLRLPAASGLTLQHAAPYDAEGGTGAESEPTEPAPRPSAGSEQEVPS